MSGRQWMDGCMEVYSSFPKFQISVCAAPLYLTSWHWTTEQSRLCCSNLAMYWIIPANIWNTIGQMHSAAIIHIIIYSDFPKLSADTMAELFRTQGLTWGHSRTVQPLIQALAKPPCMTLVPGVNADKWDLKPVAGTQGSLGAIRRSRWLMKPSGGDCIRQKPASAFDTENGIIVQQFVSKTFLMCDDMKMPMESLYYPVKNNLYRIDSKNNSNDTVHHYAKLWVCILYPIQIRNWMNSSLSLYRAATVRCFHVESKQNMMLFFSISHTQKHFYIDMKIPNPFLRSPFCLCWDATSDSLFCFPPETYCTIPPAAESVHL